MIAARQVIKRHIAIIILIFIIGSYLAIKATPENSWDGWRVGSAQALLSNKHWVKDGLLKNYLLFLPQGYSKVVRYFDDPKLRQHARGIATGGFIGKRLYYTHWPWGYLLPSAFLMKLGIQNRFWFRFLEITFSLISLGLLYYFFKLISNRLIAFWGILFYSASILFLDYADSLSEKPLDELLRFSIIILSILYKNKGKKYFAYLIWIFYFILSISSYDSTFFIFAWLVGLDFIIAQKIEWKKWIFWASAPVLAFAAQLFQNTLYLGWHNMLLDLYGAFKVQILGSRKSFLISHLKRWFEPFDWFWGVKWYLGILISILGIAVAKFIKKYLRDESLDIRFLYLGLAAILLHFLLFPSLFFYQGRIVAIFGGLLMGVLTTILIKEMAAFFKTNISIQRYIVVFGIFILVLGLWFIQGKRTYAYIKQWPNNIWPTEKIDFDQKIKNLASSDKVIFQMFGADRGVSGPDRYPMAPSEDEYYTDAPILGFTNTADLIRDFNYLKKRSEFPFSAIIIADLKTTISEVKKNLKIQKPIKKINNRFILAE